jgi:hypothetical protein
VTIDWAAEKRAAAVRLLSWGDTAVIEDAALLLVLDQSVESMSCLCEVLTTQAAGEDFEGQETIVGVLSPAWRSGEVDVPALLREIVLARDEQSQRGAAIAMARLHIDA